MADYKLSLNADPGTELAGGTPIAPGEVVNLAPEDVKANQDLVDQQLLLQVETPKKSEGGGK